MLANSFLEQQQQQQLLLLLAGCHVVYLLIYYFCFLFDTLGAAKRADGYAVWIEQME